MKEYLLLAALLLLTGLGVGQIAKLQERLEAWRAIKPYIAWKRPAANAGLEGERLIPTNLKQRLEELGEV